MHELLLGTDASAGLVLDKGGFLIAQSGDCAAYDTVTLGALSAACFAATRSIAGLVNETNFSSVYQQGEHHSLLILNVDESCLLAVVFRATTSVGAVKYYARNTVQRLADQLHAARDRNPAQGLDLSLLNLADTRSVFQRRVA